MPALAHIQAATLRRFLDAWKNWDAKAWIATFADDFTQVTMPIRLGVHIRSRAEVEQALPALIATVKSYDLKVHHILHDAEANKAAIYASSKGDLPWGPWNMEYAVFIVFSEAGDKVARVEEMLDSSFLLDFGPKFGQYLQAHGRPGSVATEHNR